MWTREPLPGEPAEDFANHRIGFVVSFNRASDTITLEDAEGNQWKAPLHETEPYAIAE